MGFFITRTSPPDTGRSGAAPNTRDCTDCDGGTVWGLRPPRGTALQSCGNGGTCTTCHGTGKVAAS